MAATAPGWDQYRSFLAVAQSGSLSAAARALRLTQPTLGRHIAALEAVLGAKLFSRSQQGLKPTEEALALIPHAEAMAASAEALQRAASGETGAARGTVRVTASEFVGALVLPAIFAAFHEKHPHIAIELAVTNRNEDLLRRDADIAVRMVRPTQGALIARRLGTVPIGLYAHRRYLARHGTPPSLEALAAHTLLGLDRNDALVRCLAVTAIKPERFAFRCNNDIALHTALRAGYGIGGCQAGIAARAGDLVPVLPGALSFPLEMWLVMHADLRDTRRVRLLYDHLAAALSAYAALQPPKAAAMPGGRRKPHGIKR